MIIVRIRLFGYSGHHISHRLEDESAFEAYKDLPQREQMQDWLRKAGIPATLADLNVTESEFQDAMATAHTLRPRYTGLTYRNEKVVSNNNK